MKKGKRFLRMLKKPKKKKNKESLIFYNKNLIWHKFCCICIFSQNSRIHVRLFENSNDFVNNNQNLKKEAAKYCEYPIKKKYTKIFYICFDSEKLG